MINFDALVLAPCMGVFARPVTVTPSASQPSAAPYDARGVWEITNVDIVTEDGGRLSSKTIKLGIRLSEFAFAPSQGDWISTQAKHLPLAYWQGQVDPNAVIDFVIDDQNPDGQGGVKLTLKRIVT